jgi:hypothetical protein
MQSFGNGEPAQGSATDRETDPIPSWVDAGVPAGADIS